MADFFHIFFVLYNAKHSCVKHIEPSKLLTF